MQTEQRKVGRWILGIGALGAIASTLIVITYFNMIHVLNSELIHDAARRNDIAEIGRILDQQPEEIEHKNRLGFTPLNEAAWEGNADAARFLLQRGANINATWD